MGLLSSHVELDELGGGRFRQSIAMRRVAYDDGGYLRRISPDWLAGNAELPHLVTLAPMIAGATNTGGYRIYPTRDLSRYIELGQPMVKPAATWVSADFRNPVRSGNTVTFQQAQGRAELRLTMAGHFLKLDCELLGGYVPPANQFAWPLSLVGLTRQGSNLLADGEVVAHLRAPHVYDAANPMDVRPIALQFGVIGGQTGVLFTLPSLAGMSRPVVDPTLSLQPAAADGKDSCIRLNVPTSNDGARVDSWIGYYSAANELQATLLQFSTTSVPSAATVNTSALALTRASNNGTYAYAYGAYQVLQAWVEGTKSIGTPADGVTWNTYDGTNNWGTAGCNNTTTDRSATAENAHAINYATDNTWTIPVMTQAWVSNPASNKGLILRTDDAWSAPGSWDAYTSDSATASERPLLTITYTLPASGTLLLPTLRHRGRR